MRILFVSPEVWPFLRVGGLAEFSHDLPLALGAAGHQVDVVTPKPRLIPEMEARLEYLDLTLEVPVSWRQHQARVAKMPLSDKVTAYLIVHEHLFDRDGLYGNAFGDYEDNAERFIFFSRAALDLAKALGGRLDAVHLNDWTTGLIPLYLKSLYAGEKVFANAGSVFTVHNLAKQGVFWHYDMPLTGLGWEYFTPEAVEYFGKISMLKAGLVFADILSTVSPSYAQEVLTPDGGQGLDGVLRTRRTPLVPVLNGVDYNAWDPKTDARLSANFSADDLGPKAECNRALREAFGLRPPGQGPLLAYVGRLLDRRGLDILAPALEGVLKMGVDVVMMGFGEDHYHNWLAQLNKRAPERLGIKIGYDMDLDHQMMAGADMLIMPSRFEPCGLHQMHAMRYGTIPVVRATGGLVDTVPDYDKSDGGVGFAFAQHSAEALLDALNRALAVYGDADKWQDLMRRAMARDFSWGSAAKKYLEIYHQAQELRTSGALES